jgi:hypothetical protein
MIASPPPEEETSSPPPTPPKKRRVLKFILWPVGIVLLLLVLLLSTTPMILSSDAARQAILDHLNATQLNGQLSIQDWSLSWTHGLTARGIELKDASNAHVLSIGQLTSNLSLARVLIGHVDLGDTQLTGIDFNLRRDKTGHLNLAEIFQPPPRSSAPPSPIAPASSPQLKLPQITGSIHITGQTCTYEDDALPHPILTTFDTIDATIKIPDINHPLQTHLAVTAHVSDQPVNLNLDGTITAVTSRLLDLDHLSATQSIALGASNSATLTATITAQRGGPLALDISQSQFDLHLLQQEHYLDLIAANWLAQKGVRFNSGVITITGKAKLDAGALTIDQPMALHIDPVELTFPDSSGGVDTAHLPQMELQIIGSSAKGMQTNLIVGPAVNALLQVNLTSSGSSAQLTQCAGDLPQIQAAVSPVLPLFVSEDDAEAIEEFFETVLNVTSGKFSASGVETFDGKTVVLSQPLNVAVNGLTIEQAGAPTPISGLNLLASVGGSFSRSGIQNLKLSFSDPDVLTCEVSGRASDLAQTRQLQNVALKVDYDLAKLWPMVRMFLSPRQQENLADLQIAGKQSRTIALAGSLDSLVSLEAYGDLGIDSISTHGISIAKLDLPFWLKDGVLRTVYQGKPEGANLPGVAACNGGTLNFGEVMVDLRGSPPRVSLPLATAGHPQKLFKNVALTPGMAKSLFGAVLNNPLFSGSDSTRGYVDLSVSRLSDLPLGDLIKQKSPANTGVAQASYSVRDVGLSGGIMSDLGFPDGTVAQINNATVSVQNGKVTQDSTVQLSATQSIRLAGVVKLQMMTFAPMNVYVPKALLAAKIDKNLLAVFPDPIQVPLKGNVSRPKVNLDQFIKDAAKESILGF